VKKFAGCMASLSRFVSQLGEKATPLYQLMKKTDHFVWSQRANDAFNNLIIVSLVDRACHTTSKFIKNTFVKALRKGELT
jgi:hypothetical protein